MGTLNFEKCLYLYTSIKSLPPITAGSKVRLKFIAARALIRRFTVYIVASELPVLTWFIVTQTCLRGPRNV